VTGSQRIPIKNQTKPEVGFWVLTKRSAASGDENVLTLACQNQAWLQKHNFQKHNFWLHVPPFLKGQCHAVWQLYKNLDGVFASIESQN